MQKMEAVQCGPACLKRLGVAPGPFTVTNVVTGAVVKPDLKPGQGPSALVPGYGASVYLRLDPVR